MASITDVARLAGVSPATASRVVSSARYAVNPATRERVLEAARTLDYVPNALARGLLKSTLPLVGVIVHDIMDPYFSEVVRGIEDAAAPDGYLVITCSSDRIAERESSYVRMLRSMRAAALIFAGSGLDDAALNADVARHVVAMRESGSAVVHLSPHARGAPEVGVDNVAGVASMVAALVELGHRHIAFLAGPTSLYVARARLEGYRKGLADAGIDFDERLVVHNSFDQAGGALGIESLLDGAAPFSAVSAANDLLAIGALHRLERLGIEVPGQLSIAGFDDIQMATLVAPSLSTVRLPLREIGRRGFETATAQIAGVRPRDQVLPTEIVLRASTAAPPATLGGEQGPSRVATPAAAAR
jgi:LacI family transcriptional regulator, galactose operon repressor